MKTFVRYMKTSAPINLTHETCHIGSLISEIRPKHLLLYIKLYVPWKILRFMSALFSFGKLTIHNYVNVAKRVVLTVVMFCYVLKEVHRELEDHRVGDQYF